MNISFDHKDTPKNQRHSQHESQSAKTHPSRTIVHAKLEMTDPGDHDEQEADAMADAVVSGGKISRKISSGGGGSSGIAVSQQMESQLSQLQGGGRPMPEGLRNMMESGFGQDFGHVRIHTDAEAADMSNSISAKAFTLGNDIYFNRGQFNPETTEGQRLVAHELTHVVQGTGKVRREIYNGPSIGPDYPQNKGKEGFSGTEFFSYLNQLKSLVNTIKLFRDINIADYIDDIIKAIKQFDFDKALLEGYEKAKLAQTGQGAARAVNVVKKGIDLSSWAFSAFMDVKRAVEKYNGSVSAECLYYSVRALATLADCPPIPWPPHVKAVLLVFNTSSGIGDLINEKIVQKLFDYFENKELVEVTKDDVINYFNYAVGRLSYEIFIEYNKLEDDKKKDVTIMNSSKTGTNKLFKKFMIAFRGSLIHNTEDKFLYRCTHWPITTSFTFQLRKNNKVIDYRLEKIDCIIIRGAFERVGLS